MELPELDSVPTVAVAVRRAATLFGDRDYVVTPGHRMSFIQAEEASRRVAKEFLTAGVGKGTRVAFQLPYGTDWVVLWLAVARIGALALPLSTSYTTSELRHALRHGDADTLVVPATIGGADRLGYLLEALPRLASSSAGERLLLEDLPYLRSVWVSGGPSPTWGRPVSLAHDGGPGDGPITEMFLEAVASAVTPADWMIVIHTSGTTAEPKAVVHTHGSAMRHAHNLARFNQMDPDGRGFCGLPFFWVGGVGVNISTALVIGSAVLCVETWDPDAALDLMERERATSVAMWPHHIKRLLDHIAKTGRDVSAIPFFHSPPATPDAVLATPLPDLGLRHGSLGMTETWGPHTAGGPERDRVLPEELRGSFGLPVTHVEHRITDPVTGMPVAPGDEGEICVRGYSVMASMLKRERHEVFDDDGWFHTGDRGRLRDGCLIFYGRLDQMIKTAGANVAPREIELVLESHPDVATAVVVGVPDPDRGEVVAAAVTPHPGRWLNLDALRDHVSAQVSNYKVPRRWLLMGQDDFPWLTTGKPDILSIRRRVADRATDGLQEDAQGRGPRRSSE